MILSVPVTVIVVVTTTFARRNLPAASLTLRNSVVVTGLGLERELKDVARNYHLKCNWLSPDVVLLARRRLRSRLQQSPVCESQHSPPSTV